MIATVAGNGTTGYTGDGGPATSAELHGPDGLALDSSGDIFIADGNANVVREVNHSTGVITTVAGTGTAGYSGDGGLATSAKLSQPADMAFDSSGNLYIADAANCVVREVNHSTGDISTFAGNGTCGYAGDGGLATSAEFSGPWGVAIDSSGNVYISDVGGQVREVNHSTGDISTIAGLPSSTGTAGNGGPAIFSQLHGPREIALDSSGNLYIGDAANNVIREINASNGDINSLDSGTGFNQAYGVAVDASGNVYVGDNNDNKVDVISPYGYALAGGGVGGSFGPPNVSVAAAASHPALVPAKPPIRSTSPPATSPSRPPMPPSRPMDPPFLLPAPTTPHRRRPSRPRLHLGPSVMAGPTTGPPRCR